MSEEASTRALNDSLKYLLYVLTLVVTAIGLFGDTFDKVRRRPTLLGYALLAIGFSAAIMNVVISRTDSRIKDWDKDQAKASAEASAKVQLEDLVKNLLPLQETQKKANQALDRAATVQEMTLSSALSQLPVDFVELWMHRKNIPVRLPEELLEEDRFAISRDIGSEEDPSSYRFSFTHEPEWPRNINGVSYSEMNYLFGDLAKRTFKAVHASVCAVTIYSAATPDAELDRAAVIKGAHLFGIRVEPDVLVFRFRPQRLPASYINNRQLVLKHLNSPELTVGPAEMRAMELRSDGSCLLPTDVRLVIAVFGYRGDTGYFRPRWKSGWDGTRAQSPPIRFKGFR